MISLQSKASPAPCTEMKPSTRRRVECAKSMYIPVPVDSVGIFRDASPHLANGFQIEHRLAQQQDYRVHHHRETAAAMLASQRAVDDQAAYT